MRGALAQIAAKVNLNGGLSPDLSQELQDAPGAGTLGRAAACAARAMQPETPPPRCLLELKTPGGV